MEHRVWVSALVLQVVLPACDFRMDQLWRTAWGMIQSLWGTGAPGGETRIIVGVGAVSGPAVLRLSVEMLAAIALAYVGSVVYFAGRLGWALWRTAAMRRQATDVTLSLSDAQRLGRYSRFFGIRGNAVQVAASPMISGPVTVGMRRRTLLLPPGFLNSVGAGDLDAVFAHECAHLRRRDFAKNLLYGLIALPAAYHPVLWLARSRLAESREMVCDAMAAEAVAGRESYARSLLRLASRLSDRPATNTLHAIGIFDTNIFERRIMNLTQKHFEMRGMRRLAVAVVCGAIAVATCASALAFRMDVNTPPAQKNPPKQLHVKQDDLKVVQKVPPVYPEEAKKEKIQGTVVLSAVIGKDGVPAELKVKEGPVELRQSALDAVRQWRWQPYLLNGDPIEVVTTVNIVYSLAK
jgi:TonB family protein